MSKSSASRADKNPGKSPPGDGRTYTPKPSLKSRPKLFVGLMLVLAGWVGVLLWLFFSTVWPIRHSISATRPGV